ncbi:MAG: TetR/AcrR family transcriptional regulator [Fusicatenibacter sp.]|nr:TetR/AcrR family transcriptional regulator [Lachnospiraceae bacterium]MDY2937368.1 TetR/AcrR family transcriptional regulator [Fusicatenibacter sp.]
MIKKENQRIALTKRLLKESLLQLMTQKNIQNISVKELCETSGINRSTFYNHYSCPADILTEIESTVIEDLEAIWKKEFEKGYWPLNKRIEALCTYIMEHHDLFKLLLRDSDTSSGFPALLMKATHVRMTYERVFSYAKSEDNKQLMTTFLSNGTYYMIRQWVLEDIPKTPKEIGDLIYMVATQGWEKKK